MRLPLPPLSLPTALLLAAAALTVGAGAGRPPRAQPVNVTVNAGQGLGTIPATAYGLNSAVGTAR